MTQQLEIFQSLWAMELRQPGVPERPMEENFRMAAAAGYHGLCIDPAVHEIDDCLKLKPLYRDYGLKCMVNAFPAQLEELPPLLELANEMDASLVNVIGQVMPLTVAEGVPVIRQWMADAEQAGLPLLFETHRDCTLNDLHYALQMIEAVPGNAALRRPFALCDRPRNAVAAESIRPGIHAPNPGALGLFPGTYRQP